jgi:hypothetical protein
MSSVKSFHTPRQPKRCHKTKEAKEAPAVPLTTDRGPALLFHLFEECLGKKYRRGRPAILTASKKAFSRQASSRGNCIASLRRHPNAPSAGQIAENSAVLPVSSSE